MIMIPIPVVLLCWVDAPLNEKIVEFARSKLGHGVGNGECRALVAEALRYAAARRPGAGQGMWGDELKSLRDVRPGDILQFENAVFIRTRVREDGALVTLTYSYPHHTAIVARVRRRGVKPVMALG
jgi:hypothetical protein